MKKQGKKGNRGGSNNHKKNGSKRGESNNHKKRWWGSGLYFVFILLILLLWAKSMYLAVFYLLLSFVTYIQFSMDKHYSMSSHWRISEKRLLLLSFLGGWPGGLLAQKYIHHKSSKKSFNRVFLLVIVLNLLSLIYLLSNNEIFAYLK